MSVGPRGGFGNQDAAAGRLLRPESLYHGRRRGAYPSFCQGVGSPRHGLAIASQSSDSSSSVSLNYHQAHHLYPGVPSYRIKELHDWLVASGALDPAQAEIVTTLKEGAAVVSGKTPYPRLVV